MFSHSLRLSSDGWTICLKCKKILNWESNLSNCRACHSKFQKCHISQVSISSTFYVCVFRKKFWRQKLQSCDLVLTFLEPKFCTKNTPVKCWWNWLHVFEEISWQILSVPKIVALESACAIDCVSDCTCDYEGQASIQASPSRFLKIVP